MRTTVTAVVALVVAVIALVLSIVALARDRQPMLADLFQPQKQEEPADKPPASPLPGKDNPAVAKILSGMQGKWRPAGQDTSWRLEVTGDRLTMIRPTGIRHEAYQIHLDPTASPVKVDLVVIRRWQLMFRGICRLDGDRLSLALRIDDDERNRPTDFKEARDWGDLVLNLEREK